jgi:hypothetical protein
MGINGDEKYRPLSIRLATSLVSLGSITMTVGCMPSLSNSCGPGRPFFSERRTPEEPNDLEHSFTGMMPLLLYNGAPQEIRGVNSTAMRTE